MSPSTITSKRWSTCATRKSSSWPFEGPRHPGDLPAECTRGSTEDVDPCGRGAGALAGRACRRASSRSPRSRVPTRDEVLALGAGLVLCVCSSAPTSPELARRPAGLGLAGTTTGRGLSCSSGVLTGCGGEAKRPRRRRRSRSRRALIRPPGRSSQTASDAPAQCRLAAGTADRQAGAVRQQHPCGLPRPSYLRAGSGRRRAAELQAAGAHVKLRAYPGRTKIPTWPYRWSDSRNVPCFASPVGRLSANGISFRRSTP